MYIQITKTDCAKIVNESLQGGGNHSEIEVALAKHAIAIHEKLDSVNNRQNTLFEALYGIYVKAMNAAGEDLKNKRLKDLQGASKTLFAASVALDQEAQKYGSGKNQDR